MKKLILLMFCMVLLVGTVSAFDFDNSIRYEKNDMKVTIENAFGLPFFGSDLGSLELKSHKTVNEVLTFGYGAEEVVMYYDFTGWDLYQNGLGEVEFKDLNTGKTIDRDYSFVYWGEKERDTYTKFCQNIALANTTIIQDCNSIVDGTEQYFDWLPYNSRDIPKEDVRIGLKTYVQKDDRIDGVWTIAGEKLSRHATWTAELTVGLVAYYPFNSSSGTTAYDRYGSHNGALQFMEGNEWVVGHLGNAIDMGTADEHIDVDSSSDFNFADAFSISVWVEPDATDADGRIVYMIGAGPKGFHLSQNPNGNGNWRFSVYADGEDVINSTSPPSGSYEHIVVTRLANGTLTMYIDSVAQIDVETSTGETGNTVLVIGATDGPETEFNGEIDELGFWNRSISQAEIDELYNSGTGITYSSDVATFELSTPIEAFNSSVSTIEFSGRVYLAATVDNVSLIIDGVYNETNSSGLDNVYYNFSKDIADGDYNWTYESCDDTNTCTNLTARNFSIDTTTPVLYLTEPRGTILLGDAGVNETLLWNVTDSDLDECWYDYDFTNVSVVCTLNITTFILTPQRNITFWANDSGAHKIGNYSTWEYDAFVNSFTYNASSFVTEQETFYVNLTTNGSSLTDGELIYDGTSYAATITNIAGNVYNISRAIDIPLNNETKDFNFNYTLGGVEYNTTTQTQLINKTEFGLCNATLIEQYINFTFKDEESDVNINATVDASTWNYWLGNGSIYKTMLYSNTSLNYDYTFCLDAGNRTLNNNVSFQFASIGYPQRTYTSTNYLTNTTTNQTLYLLANADGIYTTMQVVDGTLQSVIGVNIVVERQFAGVWTIIGEDVTDDSGSATFWVNPDYDHRFTFTSDDCTGTVTTIRPTQSLYTQQLSCADTSPDEYISSLLGIQYDITPKVLPWLSENTIYAFTFNVTANLSNLVSYYMNITDADGNELNATLGTTNTGGNLTVLVDTTGHNKLYGYFYIDVGNGTTLIDPFIWNARDVEPGRGSIYTFFINLKDAEVDIEDNYNNLMLIFFVFFVSLAAFTYSTGMELNQPGICLFIIFFFVLLMSVSGYLTVNFTTIEANKNTFIDQYGIGLVVLFLTAGYSLGQWGKS